jgi:hypothetical protein
MLEQASEPAERSDTARYIRNHRELQMPVLVGIADEQLRRIRNSRRDFAQAPLDQRELRAWSLQ